MKTNVRFVSEKTDENNKTEVHAFESIGESDIHEGKVYSLSFFDDREGETAVKSEITFFFEGDEIIMQRTGDVLMEQRFVAGKQTNGVYRTEHGSFAIEAGTTSILIQHNEDGTGEIGIAYRSFIGNEWSGDVLLNIQYVREIKEEKIENEKEVIGINECEFH